MHGRLFKAKGFTVAALFIGMWISRPLWTSWTRQIPRVPVIGGVPSAAMPWIEFILSSLLILAMIGVALRSNRTHRFLVAIAVLLIPLVLLDQSRLQPWVYQYWLLLVVFALVSRDRPDGAKDRRAVALAQLIIAALYFWSGLQKLNYTFIHETLPNLLLPVQAVLGFRLPITAIAFTVIGAELFTGVALHFRRTRKIAVVIAVAMHCGVLALLISRGYNHVVWVWNILLLSLNVILFWNCEIFAGEAFRGWRAQSLASRFAHVIVGASVVLPALSFVGWWDMYLSGALYSGNTEIAVIKVDPRLLGQLPPAARSVVFTTGAGETVLPLQEWSLREMQVPPYPQLRVYRQIASAVCAQATDRDHTGLIVRGRPNILTGSFEVIRISCADLVR